MRRRYISAHDLAIEICRREHLSYKRVKDLAERLLLRYSQGLEDANNRETLSPEEIKKEKQNIRRRYIEIILGIREFSEKEYADFAWDVVSSSWFKEKAAMILDMIEERLDRRITQQPYDPEKDRLNQGIQIKHILRNAFLNGKNRIMDDEAIYTDMQISRATYGRRKPEGIVLFGILMWRYAKKRELEDLEKGEVEEPEYDIRALLEQGNYSCV